ncbi:MAG: hypothetical protein PVJ80_12105 [Gemmatimonadota bacterium]|jgi:hypothetical protein
MTTLTEFLFPAPARRSAGAIILWWEGRRLAFNLCVGSAGVVSLFAVTGVAAIHDGVFVLPYLLVPAGVFGVLANACYLLGPAAEILIHAVWGRRVLPTGPTLYRMGLTFSVGLALLPTLLVTLVLVVSVVVEAVPFF